MKYWKGTIVFIVLYTVWIFTVYQAHVALHLSPLRISNDDIESILEIPKEEIEILM